MFELFPIVRPLKLGVPLNLINELFETLELLISEKLVNIDAIYWTRVELILTLYLVKLINPILILAYVA